MALNFVKKSTSFWALVIHDSDNDVVVSRLFKTHDDALRYLYGFVLEKMDEHQETWADHEVFGEASPGDLIEAFFGHGSNGYYSLDEQVPTNMMPLALSPNWQWQEAFKNPEADWYTDPIPLPVLPWQVDPTPVEETALDLGVYNPPVDEDEEDFIPLSLYEGDEDYSPGTVEAAHQEIAEVVAKQLVDDPYAAIAGEG